MSSRFFCGRSFLLVGLLGLSMQAHATYVGDLVYCDVNNDGRYDVSDGDFGLDGVRLEMTCADITGAVCFSGTTTTGPAVLETPFINQLGGLCADAPLTWDPSGDVSGRYLFEISRECSAAARPAACTITVIGELPNTCDVLGTPRVTAMGNMPARPVDTNDDGDFCDVQTGFIPPDDGPFPEGQPLGSTPTYGGCEDRPDPAPGDGTYTVIIGPGSDECSIYNDFAYKPPGPAIDIEKATNGVDADDANAGDAPQVVPGQPVFWEYVVTNIGPVTLINIMVTDDQIGTITCPTTTLPSGGFMTCTASGTAEDLFNTGFTTVPGRCGNIPDRPLYENMGRATGVSELGQFVEDEDPSHYCNPPGPDIDIEKATNGVDADDPNAGDAPQIVPGAPVTWTYVVTNTGDVPLQNVTVDDDQIGPVICPQDTLAVGESIECTANGIAEDLGNTGFTTVPGLCGGIPQRPLYENMGMATGQTVAGTFVEDTDPSHYCNPLPCGLTLEKACEVVTPAPETFTCDNKVDAITMILSEGLGNVANVTAYLGDTSKDLVPAGNISINGNEVTVTGYQVLGAPNDVVWQLVTDIGGTYQSEFHLSCSDKEMDGETDNSAFPQDCGRPQGNGKDNSSGDNVWLLEGMVTDKGFVLDCTLDAPVASECEFQAVAADCDFPVSDPDILTFRVSGGDCGASDNDQKPDKTECTGGFINPNEPVQVSVNGGTVFTLEAGETFDIERGGDPEIELFQGNVTQFNKFHASCSQPLQAGDRYGANELVALDGEGLGTNVLYSYLVGNAGSGDLTGITVTDNPLGPVPGSPIALLPQGASEVLTASAFITQTTTNTATAVASPTCAANSNAVVVTVEPAPPCEASIAFKELKDDAIKWTLSNGSSERKATMETFTLDFPPAYGLIEEVKLDGAIFKATDSITYPDGVPSGQTIGADDWTEEEVVKRQLDRGESRTLEVKFTGQSKDFGQGDFDLTVTFEEGCMVTF